MEQQGQQWLPTGIKEEERGRDGVTKKKKQAKKKLYPTRRNACPYHFLLCSFHLATHVSYTDLAVAALHRSATALSLCLPLLRSPSSPPSHRCRCVTRTHGPTSLVVVVDVVGRCGDGVHGAARIEDDEESENCDGGFFANSTVVFHVDATVSEMALEEDELRDARTPTAPPRPRDEVAMSSATTTG